MSQSTQSLVSDGPSDSSGELRYLFLSAHQAGSSQKGVSRFSVALIFEGVSRFFVALDFEGVSRFLVALGFEGVSRFSVALAIIF